MKANVSATKVTQTSMVYPLTPQQFALWLLYQREPENKTYNMGFTARIVSEVNVSALRAAFQQISDRHAALRTIFLTQDGEPRQQVLDKQDIFFVQVETSISGNGSFEQELYEQVISASRQPFCLETGPLLRVYLFTQQVDQHILLISMHHIISDGWSIDILLNELRILYPALSLGEEGELPETTTTYADYVSWLHNIVQGPPGQRMADFWHQHLSSEWPMLDLPWRHQQSLVTQAPQDTTETAYAGASIGFALSKSLTDRLRTFALHYQLDLPAICLTALQALFLRYTGQSDFVIGVAMSGRMMPKSADLFGYLSNIVMIRNLFTASDTALTAIQNTAQFMRRAQLSQSYPYPLLDQQLRKKNKIDHQQIDGLVQVTFNYRKTVGELSQFWTPSERSHNDLDEERISTQEIAQVDWGSLLMQPLPFPNNETINDLYFEIIDGGEQLKGAFRYQANRIDTDFIKAMTAHIQILLTDIIDNPRKSIVKLSLLSELEHDLLQAWNDTAADFGPAEPIQVLFERQVSRTPDEVALVFGNEALTYADVNGRANQLAHYLMALGTESETLVAVAVERSLEMVIALLGVLKAGGAYVPLDPHFPRARLDYMLWDSGAPILLTQSHLFGAGAAEHVVWLDQLGPDLGAYSRHNPAAVTSPEHLAYVIYTSGSTGEPKGISITHGSVFNLLHAMARHPGLTAEDELLSVTTISFDIAVLELYLPLMVGARVVLASDEDASDPQALIGLLHEHRISVMQATPATWTMLTSHGGWRSTPRLKILCGGEALPLRLATRLLEHSESVWNLYGPTEATVWVSAGQLASDLHQITLAGPIANTTYYILDEWGELLPLGVGGELHIGGLQLARGYLNRAELTAERFIDHPEFGHLYKTGDVCRWLASGELVFMGRTDLQVKVRGFRIELGEIEHALLAQDGVEEAVLLAREDEPGTPRLVAYVVGEAEDGALREELSERLPAYMIPSAFVRLDALPLTPNGKVDRRALPAPDYAASQAEYVAPRDDLERQVGSIWGEVLGLDRVGVYDTFFALGGHSLLATQVMSRLRSQLHLDVPLKTLFEALQLAAFAQAVGQMQRRSEAAIEAVSRDGDLPLSFAQQRLWFLDQLEPESAFYNMPVMLRVQGPLDVEALERSISDVIKRHESLRTTFDTVDGEPMQVIHDAMPFTLPVMAVADLSQAQDLGQVEAATPFNLQRGPLLRVQLLRISESDHVLLLTMHHIVSDGWSIGVLIEELSHAYTAYVQGETPTLPELPIQYADFAVWQRGVLSGERLEQQLTFWREHLRDAPALLELPTDRPRPAVQSYRGAHYAFELDSELTAELKQLAQGHDATLFMVLLAAFQVLLARYSGQRDIVVGSPIANRNRSEIEGLIGFFVNTLVLRSQLDDNPSFIELLTRVRQTTLSAYDHQDLPFEQLVDALDLERSLSYSPLFQVMLVLQNAQRRDLTLPDVSVRLTPTEFPFSRFDLTLFLFEEDEGLTGLIEYNTDLFDPSTLVRLSAHFVILLRSMVTDPAQPVLHVPLLTPSEYHQLVHDWNDTVVDFGPARPIQVLFEDQVARTPDEVALVFGDEALTYADLNAQANQLAHHLMALGTEAETLVAVAMERSLEMVIALLGVLKAGGAYVPLDPHFPRARLDYMLWDSGAPILLTQSHLFGAGAAEHVVWLDQLGPDLGAYSRHNPAAVTSPEHLAYVIYTSGSTGEPKGISITHGSVFNLLHAMARHPGLTAEDELLSVTTISFDIAVLELYLPLMVGARVVLASDEDASDPQALIGLLHEHRISVMQATPATWTMLTSHGGWRSTPRLKILCGGEALPLRLATRLLEHSESVWNLYGPTEATVWVSAGQLASDLHQITLAGPIANTTYYILDEWGELLPLGVGGELHIGGLQLARGYLNRAELTAERFIDHPEFGHLYKTGDVCRWLASGELVFMGRTDLQVKVRGFRIELGEIEHTLLAQDGVEEAVLLAREDEPGTPRLVAYVVGEAEDGALREELSERLPAYMIPSAFVRLDALPLTPNGKVDRRALPAPDYAASQAEYVAPRDDLERQVGSIWGEVLGLDRVGVYDTFFALGGHSLLATQVMSRLRSQLHLDVPLKTLFEALQLAAFAQAVGQMQRRSEAAIEAVSRDGDLPLSFAQQRLWFLDQLEPESAFYNMPAMLRVQGPLDVEALERSISDVIKRHESLRTTFDTVDGEPMQVIHDAMPFTLPVMAVADLSQAQDLGQVEAATPFNLQRGPLLRVQLLRISESDHVLLLTMHHIVSDGWSIGVLIEELSHAYTAYVQGETPTLPELPIQYADFAVWQRGVLSGERLEQQLTFWREHLRDAPALLELPTDRPRPAVQSYRGAHYAFELDSELTAELKQLAQGHDATLFMVLLAAFQVLLARYSGQRDIVVGSPIANRNRSEIEGLIGFFVNTLVLRTQLDDNPSFTSLLQRVRQTTLEAYEHQDLPFEQLVDELQLERTLSYSPLFQVMLVLQNVDQRALTLPHLTATSYDAVFPFARFDLTLNLIDQDSGLLGVFEYNTDLFDEASIARMAGHFAVLLNRMVLQPDQPVLTLPFLTEIEHQQIVVEWNATATDYSADQTINQLFETQVELRPDSTAVVFEAERLTYRELNQRANQLAYFLQRLGVGPEVLVGICIERSIDMVVGLLGILKAGGAYVPLDPTYPADRLTFMLADADLSVLLTQAHLRHHLPQMQTGIVCLDSDWTDIQSYPHDNPTFTAEPAHLAYVIYTSGSTGQPKGVLVEHRELYNLARAQIEAFGVDSHHRVLQFSSLNFDASISEIVMTLCSGATLYLAHAVNLLPGANLTKTLNQHRISHVTLVPSVITHLSPSDLPDLETVIVAGEACPSELVKSWSPGRRFFNAYGPTETTVCATIMPFEDDLGTYLTPPIGKPIANLQVYLVDEHLQLVPVGVPGELLIGGVGLARGYLNRPELTQEKFIPNPFGPGRLYKTGDLARWLPDGNLMFMGRTDFQVKIRGFRIELGEIENVLLTHDGIHEAVVLARENQLGDQSLIAYVVQDDDLDLGLLRQRLAQSLPAYMIPSVFVQLDAMPLTPNGKLDPQALPSPTKQADIAQRPLSETETRLRSIWKELLNLDSIGIHDNFFDIGGHSLLSVRLIARIQQDFGRDIDITTLFQGATIEILAELIDRQQQVTGRGSTKANTRPPLVALQPQGHGAPFFWVHPIGGRLFSYMKLAHCLGNQRAVYGLEALGLYSGEAPLKTIEAMASSYIKAIQTVQPRGPYYLGGWSFGGIVAFEMAQQLHRDGAEIGLLTLLESFIYAEATWHQQLAMQNDESPLRAEFVQDLQASMGLSPEEMLMQFIETTPSESLNAPTMPSDLEGYQRLWQVYKANRQAATQYHPKPYSGKPMFIWADQTNEHLKTAWYKVVTQADHHTVTGDHYSIMTDPTIRIIAQRIVDACSNSNDS